MSAAEADARTNDDRQDAELVRVAAYAGLRRGDLVALGRGGVDFERRKLVVRRAVSGDVVASSTKSRRAGEVPLADQAAGALARLSRRGDFTSADDYVFCNRLGRRLDGSALRRRVERARDAAGLPRLRFHDLQHTYGALLVAGGACLHGAGLTQVVLCVETRCIGLAAPRRLGGLRGLPHQTQRSDHAETRT